MDLRLDVPGLSGDTQKDIKNLSSYVFRLSEDLRYALYNLDVTNFNDLGLARYENGRLQIYTEQLSAAVKKLELKIGGEKDSLRSEIQADAEQLRISFENAEKDLQAMYEFSADGLRGEILQGLGKATDGVNEKVAQWQLTVDGFSTTFTQKLAEVNQKVTTWSADIDGFLAQIETAEGKIAKWEVTDSSITSLVEAIGSDGSKLKTVIKQEISEDEALLQLIANRVDIAADVVTFSDLTDGKTEISGDNILTGSIRSATFVADGCEDAFVVEDGWENAIGTIGYSFEVSEDDGENRKFFGDKIWIETKSYYYDGAEYFPSIKLKAAGRISMEALAHGNGRVYIAARDYVTLNGENNGIYIYDGTAEWRFRNGHLYLEGKIVL